MNYISIHYLRAVAALMVVFCYIEIPLARIGYQGFWPGFLEGGVDIFFVISGFVIFLSIQSRSMGVLDFYKRRLMRIVPLYWIVTTFLVLVAIFTPQFLKSIRFDAMHVAASYAFLPYPSPADGLLYPILVPGWTLNYEMLFYAAFGLCLFLLPRWRVLAVSAVLIALPLLGILVRPDWPPAIFLTSSILLEFLFGVGIAWVLSKCAGSRKAGVSLLFAGMMLFMASPFIAQHVDLLRFILLGVPATMIVSGALLLEKARALPIWPLPKLLGDSSYALYLTHGIALSAMGQLWLRLPFGSGGLSLAVFSILTLLASLLGGIVTYRLVDEPLQNWLRANTARSRPAQLSA
jgi:exopolysaccharide production protein ExoZ